jgi:hypothetical protein
MRKGLFVILGICALAVSVSMATPSPTAKNLLWRLSNVEQRAGVYVPDVTSHNLTATQIDDSLFGIVLNDSIPYVTRANGFLARCTFAKPLALSDSIIGVTADFSGKIVGGASLAITGTGSFSGILSPLSVTLPGGATIANPASPGTTLTFTETNIALVGVVAITGATGITGRTAVTGVIAGSDSIIGVTGNFSGKVTAATFASTGAATVSTIAIGSSGSVITKAIVVGDSLGFVVGTDTMWAFQPGTK